MRTIGTEARQGPSDILQGTGSRRAITAAERVGDSPEVLAIRSLDHGTYTFPWSSASGHEAERCAVSSVTTRMIAFI